MHAYIAMLWIDMQSPYVHVTLVQGPVRDLVCGCRLQVNNVAIGTYCLVSPQVMLMLEGQL